MEPGSEYLVPEVEVCASVCVCRLCEGAESVCSCMRESEGVNICLTPPL